MTKVLKFRVHPSGLIHMGKQDPEKSKAVEMGFLPPEAAEMFYLSLCGRKLVGQLLTEEPMEWEPVCRRCTAVLDHARKVYEEMERKFT